MTNPQPEEQPDLDAQLAQACWIRERNYNSSSTFGSSFKSKAELAKEAIETATALLDQGADVNGNGTGRPLYNAAMSKNEKLVEFLLLRGADPAIVYSGKTIAEHAKTSSGNPTTALLQSHIDNSPDEVSIMRSVGGNMLQEVFDFRRLERMTFVHKGGSVTCFTRDSFSDVKDEITLRQAFNEHARRGGTREESEIFTKSTLPKTVIKGPPLS